MNAFLWNLQGVLAAVFLVAGLRKIVQDRETLAERLPLVREYSPATLRLIGTAELAAVLGLLLPGILGIATVLTPLAATGLVVLMLLAAIAHGRRGDTASIGLNIVLLVLAAIVTWGRFGPHSL